MRLTHLRTRGVRNALPASCFQQSYWLPSSLRSDGSLDGQPVDLWNHVFERLMDHAVLPEGRLAFKRRADHADLVEATAPAGDVLHIALRDVGDPTSELRFDFRRLEPNLASTSCLTEPGDYSPEHRFLLAARRQGGDHRSLLRLTRK